MINYFYLGKTTIYDKLGLFGGLTVVGSAPLVTLDIINFQDTFKLIVGHELSYQH